MRSLGTAAMATVAGPNYGLIHLTNVRVGYKGEVRGLTGRWRVDADVRKVALRGGVDGAEEEDVGELGVASGKKMRGLEVART